MWWDLTTLRRSIECLMSFLESCPTCVLDGPLLCATKTSCAVFYCPQNQCIPCAAHGVRYSSKFELGPMKLSASLVLCSVICLWTAVYAHCISRKGWRDITNKMKILTRNGHKTSCNGWHVSEHATDVIPISSRTRAAHPSHLPRAGHRIGTESRQLY